MDIRDVFMMLLLYLFSVGKVINDIIVWIFDFGYIIAILCGRIIGWWGIIAIVLLVFIWIFKKK